MSSPASGAASDPEMVRFSGCPPQPWANGGGTTRVLATDERDGAWTYRVSVADLDTAQRFSVLPGIDRHLLFLGPGCLTLRINDDSLELAPLQQVRFEGEDTVESVPSSSSARDLNVMTRRGASTARLRVTRVLDVFLQPTPERRIALWIALEPDCAVNGQRLEPLDAAVLRAGRTTHTDGRGLLVDIESASPHEVRGGL